MKKLNEIKLSLITKYPRFFTLLGLYEVDVRDMTSEEVREHLCGEYEDVMGTVHETKELRDWSNDEIDRMGW